MIYVIGEAVIDRISNTSHHKLMVGGAPFNVCNAIKKLKGDCIFISQIGNDDNGKMILKKAKKLKLDLKYIQILSHPSNVIDVAIDEKNERHFIGVNNLSLGNISQDLIPNITFTSKDILYFGSNTLMSDITKKTVISLIKQIKEKEGIVAFDPNVRLNFWKDANSCKETIKEFISYADILKVSEEEQHFLDIRKTDKQMLILTKGKCGSSIYYQDKVYNYSGKQIPVVDTIGAGDAYMGAFLYQYNCNKDVYRSGLLASFVSTIVCMSQGAMDYKISKKEIKKIIS